MFGTKSESPASFAHDAEMGYQFAGTESMPLMTGYRTEPNEQHGTESTPLMGEYRTDENEQHVPECGGIDVLHFSSPICYVDETEDSIKITVFRLGTMKGKVAVQFSTEDGSAQSPDQYEKASGRLVFADGQFVKTILIPICHACDWRATQEFSVNLRETENCKMDSHLHCCRVKIINSIAFPSNEIPKIEEESETQMDRLKRAETTRLANNTEENKKSGYASGAHDWKLFREYFKLTYKSAGVSGKTTCVLVFDQLSSIFLFGTLWIGVYTVDTLFSRGGHSSERLLVGDRYHTAMIIALWYVIPIAVLYLWDAIKVFMDIKGSARRFLQTSLMQTYLELTSESRQTLTPTDMHSAITISAEQIATSYVAALTILGPVGRIVAIIIFIILFQPELLAICLLVTMVVVVLAFVVLRLQISQRAQERVEERLLLLETLTDDACRKFRLLADYARRALMKDMFASAADEYSKEVIPEAIIHLNTRYTTKFLSGMCIAIYIVVKAPQVLSGQLSLGIFLAVITIFCTYLFDAITELNDQLVLIVDAFVPLKEYTTYLNLPLELAALKLIDHDRGKETQRRCFEMLTPRAGHAAVEDAVQHLAQEDGETLPTSGTGPICKTDTMPIELHNIEFGYNVSSKNGTKYKALLRGVSMTFPQGEVVSVTGPPDCGKSSFMQLLSTIRIPTGGTIFMPSHLRVLHVSPEPIFLRASILHNLTLGLPRHDAVDPQHICGVLEMLGLADIGNQIQAELLLQGGDYSDEVATSQSLKQVDHNRSFIDDDATLEEVAESTWEQSLSKSRKIKLHLARAFIANPEVLVLHHTLQGLQEDAALGILGLVREHVKSRGLGLPEATAASRRPRTVFFSTHSRAQALTADRILEFDPENKTFEACTPRSSVDRDRITRGVSSKLSALVAHSASKKVLVQH